MNFLLTVLGVLLLLMSLAGVAFGLFMALDSRTRQPGLYFALWWTPAVAATGGILMRDPVTFAIGGLCFVVAGAAFALERRSSRQRPVGREKRPRPGNAEERTTYREKARGNSSKPWFSEERKQELSGRVKFWFDTANQVLDRAKRRRSERPRTRK